MTTDSSDLQTQNRMETSGSSPEPILNPQDKFSFLDERSDSREQELSHDESNLDDKRLARNYDRAAKFYELSAEIFSTGRIRASKRAQLKYINPGDRIVYLGTGGGEDAVMAAKAGAEVTCIDISQGMLDQVERKLSKEGLKANLICQSAFDYQPEEPFDICAANYFLNVFRSEDMIKMMHHSAKFVRPGGKYLIADVALPQGNILSRAFNASYLKLAMCWAWMIGLVPLHENYDYAAHFEQCGLTLGDVRYFRFAKHGPVLFQSIMAERAE